MNICQNNNELWVHIEITPEAGPVKYEYDHEMGLVVDRFMRMPMYYPLPYGYAPNTLCQDGDALDVLVMVPHKIMPTSWICVRPVAVMMMEDEAGRDEKILAVPISSVCHSYDHIRDLQDVPLDIIQKIEDFFGLYKNRDHSKWCKLGGWFDADFARECIDQAIENFMSTRI